jgi:hypothetical protein
MAMMSWSSLLLLQDLLDADGRVVVVLADVLRIQDAGGRRQRVNGRVDAHDAISRESSVVASRCAKVVAGAGSV